MCCLPSHPTPKKLLCEILYCVTRGISEGILSAEVVMCWSFLFQSKALIIEVFYAKYFRQDFIAQLSACISQINA